MNSDNNRDSRAPLDSRVEVKGRLRLDWYVRYFSEFHLPPGPLGQRGSAEPIALIVFTL